jgi:RNA polymerase sigma-70 factor (ECF subfamily)
VPEQEKPELSFEETCRKYYGKVFAYLRARVRARDVLPDLTQEVFFRYWKYLRKGPEIGNTAATIYHIAGWVYKDHLSGALGHPAEPMEDVELPAVSPPALLDKVQLERCLKKLDDLRRKVLIQQKVEGYAHEEIAARLGISSGYSRQCLHEAREFLKKCMKHGPGSHYRLSGRHRGKGRESNES